MKNLLKRALSLAVALVMVLGMVPLAPLTASAASASTPTYKSTSNYKWIFANGTHLYIVAGTSSGTAVYYESGSSKVYVNPNGAAGDDLSGFSIFGGCEEDYLNGDANITMTGGNVRSIYGAGTHIEYPDSGYVNNVNITVSGGTVGGSIAPGLSRGVRGNVNITVTGGTVSNIWGSITTSQNSTGSGPAVRVYGDVNIVLTGGSVGQVISPDGYNPADGTVTGVFLIPTTLKMNQGTVSDKTNFFHNLLYLNGSTWTRKGSVTIPSGATLTVAAGQTLNPSGITNNGTIINNGTVNVTSAYYNAGSIVNNGTLNLSAPITGKGFTGSGTVNISAAYIEGVTSVSGLSAKVNGSAYALSSGYYRVQDGNLYIFLPSGNSEVTVNGQQYYGVTTSGKKTALVAYVDVTDITGIPTEIPANRSITLSAVLKPASGYIFPQTVTYELLSGPEGTTLENGVLYAPGAGTVSIQVVAQDTYKTYSKTFDIQSVFTPVTGLSSSVPEVLYKYVDYDLTQYTAVPADASYWEVEWSVVDSDNSTALLRDDKLYGYASGTIVLRATVKNGLAYGTDYIQDFTVEFKNVTMVGREGEIYYWIKTPEELVWFSKYASSNPGTNGLLGNDIDMTGYVLDPVCETGLYYNAYGEDMGYTGTFDGDYYVIRNLTVKSSTTMDASAGLFGTVSGTVKNLGMENFTFVDGGYDIRAGAIAGQLITETGLIENCYVVGATINPGAHVTGGIAGCVYDGTIQNCHVYNSTITGTSGRFGHIVGDSRGDVSETDRPGTVKNCYTDGAAAYSSRTGNIEVCETKSADAFATGEVGYLLNGSQETGIWKQDVETVAYPSFQGKTIYSFNKGYGNVITVIFSGPTVTDTVYNGQPYAGLGGEELTNDENYTGTVEILYTGVNGTEYSSQEPPTNAGDYVLSYSIPEDNEKYVGKLELPFTIKQESLDNLQIEGLNEWYDYLGYGNVIPELSSVTCDGLTLVENVDYKRTFENNLYPGTATMTITGIGNFTGSKSYTFVIYKHEHNWQYTFENMALTQTCTTTEGTCEAREQTMTFSFTSNLIYDGTAKYLRYDGGIMGSGSYQAPTITYCCEGGCIDAGDHTAHIEIAGQEYDVPFTIAHRELTLTVVGGYKFYDGTPDVEILWIALDGVLLVDEGDSSYDYDNVYEDVTIDYSQATAVLDSAAAGTYTTVKLTGVTLGGTDLYNYKLVTDMDAAPIKGQYDSVFYIHTLSVRIVANDQNIGTEDAIDQTAYTAEGLPEEFILSGVVLEEEDTNIYVNIDNLKVTHEGTDVTEFVSVSTYSGKIQRVCSTHDTSNNGFCATCNVYEPAVKKIEVDE